MSRSNKLTNKQIEEHLTNIYNTITEESKILNLTMKVLTDFVTFTGNKDKFETYLQGKYKKDEAKKVDKPIAKK